MSKHEKVLFVMVQAVYWAIK